MSTHLAEGVSATPYGITPKKDTRRLTIRTTACVLGDVAQLIFNGPLSTYTDLDPDGSLSVFSNATRPVTLGLGTTTSPAFWHAVCMETAGVAVGASGLFMFRGRCRANTAAAVNAAAYTAAPYGFLALPANGTYTLQVGVAGAAATSVYYPARGLEITTAAGLCNVLFDGIDFMGMAAGT